MQLMIRVGTSRMAERRADGVDQSRSPAATSPCRAGLVILLALSVRTAPVCSLLRRLGILDNCETSRDQNRSALVVSASRFPTPGDGVARESVMIDKHAFEL